MKDDGALEHISMPAEVLNAPGEYITACPDQPHHSWCIYELIRLARRTIRAAVTSLEVRSCNKGTIDLSAGLQRHPRSMEFLGF